MKLHNLTLLRMPVLTNLTTWKLFFVFLTWDMKIVSSYKYQSKLFLSWATLLLLIDLNCLNKWAHRVYLAHFFYSVLTTLILCGQNPIHPWSYVKPNIFSLNRHAHMSVVNLILCFFLTFFIFHGCSDADDRMCWKRNKKPKFSLCFYLSVKKLICIIELWEKYSCLFHHNIVIILVYYLASDRGLINICWMNP